MLRIISRYLTIGFEKYLPSSFLFALLLTLLTVAFAFVATPSSLVEIAKIWGEGFWNLNSFAMEMVLVLVTGSALARSPFIEKIFIYCLKIVKNQTSANLCVLTLSSLACLFNWGFGLIVSGLFILHIKKRSHSFDYAQLVASGYGGFLLWHGGLSGSIPLKLTSPSELIQDIIGVTQVSLNETIFSSYNILLIIGNFAVMGLLMAFIGSKSKEQSFDIDSVSEQNQIFQESNDKSRPVDQLERSKVFMGVFLLFAILYIFSKVGSGDFLNLKNLSFIFLILGMALHKSFFNYQKAFGASIENSSGIILQFPFYAGIMAIMSQTELATLTGQFILKYANPENFLVLTFWSAGLVNFFVPSGGGQWAIQAPMTLPVAMELNIPVAKTAMALAWGDAWTNMIQPFWALALLSLTGIKLSKMMYYSFLIFLLTGVVSSLIFAII